MNRPQALPVGRTPQLSPQEIRDVVAGWIDGNELGEIEYRLSKQGKGKSRRFLTRLFMGVIHQSTTNLKRSETYVEACIRYRKRKEDEIFGN